MFIGRGGGGGQVVGVLTIYSLSIRVLTILLISIVLFLKKYLEKNEHKQKEFEIDPFLNCDNFWGRTCSEILDFCLPHSLSSVAKGSNTKQTIYLFYDTLIDTIICLLNCVNVKKIENKSNLG